jgi:NarL family two-component system sensor histidine kinase LiaS
MDVSAIAAAFWEQWQPQVFAFVLLASALGTLVGLAFSRSLTRRLHRIALATDAWSRGEFAVSVADSSRDELGQLAQNLNSMAQQLQALLGARSQLAVMQERQRLQRELHDAVKQQLFATAMHIAAARAFFASETQQAFGHIVEAEQLAGEAQRELTTLIQALRPDDLQGKRLPAALEDLCQRWSRQTGIRVEASADSRRAIPGEVEAVLYRVAQEALSNVARHSGATVATLRQDWEGETTVLSVQDNGQGFDATATATGLGLSGMRERLATISGALQIESSSVGTKIVARVPMVHEAVLDG